MLAEVVVGSFLPRMHEFPRIGLGLRENPCIRGSLKAAQTPQTYPLI